MEDKARIIKAVAFDFGGVIEVGEGPNILEQSADILGIPFEEFKTVYWRYNYLSNVKNLPWEEGFMQVIAEFDASPAMATRIRAAIAERDATMKINTDLVSLFPRLRQSGYKVGILSNATTALREKLDLHHISELTDAVVISGEIGFQKPHKEAFDVLFQGLGLKAEEVVFIDDAPKSLEKAAEIGYTPILFTSNEQLVKDLAKLGILA